jgi:3-deoxy-D-manno-octulosonic-acid transferase
MQFLYNILVDTVKIFIPVIALFNAKMKLFYFGRKETTSKLSVSIKDTDRVIWMHCASLGEFEQGKPVLEKLQQQFPKHKIVLSFFSPSGYEVRKDCSLADVVVYLPLDTRKDSKHFLQLIHPDLAIFVKYEFWPNILQELKKQAVKTILISGIFRENQAFFTKKTEWIRTPLKAFTHFFVQDRKAVSLLKSIGFENVTMSGDTRFDTVFDLVNQREELDVVAVFSKENHVLVAGSTWEKDEELLIHYINNEATDGEKFIIAPHNINMHAIDLLIQKLKPNTLLYSSASLLNIPKAKVLIIDSIGLLTRVYAYANIAYVGGGFGSGIHNILEPATYGIPIIIGPKYQKFNEAIELIQKKATFVVHSKHELTSQLHFFYSNKEVLKATGAISLNYIKENIGATTVILSYISQSIFNQNKHK